MDNSSPENEFQSMPAPDDKTIDNNNHLNQQTNKKWNPSTVRNPSEAEYVDHLWSRASGLRKEFESFAESERSRFLPAAFFLGATSSVLMLGVLVRKVLFSGGPGILMSILGGLPTIICFGAALGLVVAFTTIIFSGSILRLALGYLALAVLTATALTSNNFLIRWTFSMLDLNLGVQVFSSSLFFLAAFCGGASGYLTTLKHFNRWMKLGVIAALTVPPALFTGKVTTLVIATSFMTSMFIFAGLAVLIAWIRVYILEGKRKRIINQIMSEVKTTRGVPAKKTKTRSKEFFVRKGDRLRRKRR